uniref:Gag-pol polyprotein n=1 Tax=Solanum tuberosum TaxID=4113 RepID=M1DT04_SOLTU
MNVKEYALKFTQFSKYAPTMVANSRFSGQGSSNDPTLKFNKERMSNPKPQGGGGSGSSILDFQSVARSTRENG